MVKTALNFLNDLKGLSEGDKTVLCYFSSDNRSRFFKEFDGKIDLNKNFNIYYTVNPRDVNKTYPNGQGKKEDVKRVVGFFCDIDCGSEGHTTESFYNTKDDALKAVKDFFIKPTYVVDSGHGLQVLWFFKKALILDKDINLQKYEELNGKIQNFLKADYTKDASRILRLPGSINVKNPENPVTCKIISSTKKRCSIDDFEQFFNVIESAEVDISDKNASIGDTPPELKEKIFNSLKKVDYNWRLPGINKRISGIIKEGKDIRNPGKNDRSAMIQTVVDSLICKKYSYDEVYSILINPKYRISEKILELKSEEQQKKYVALSIYKALPYLNLSELPEDLDEFERIYKKKIDRYFTNFKVLGTSSEDKALIWCDGDIHDYDLHRFYIENAMLICKDANLSRNEFKLVKNRILKEVIENGRINESKYIRNGVWKDKEGFCIVSGKNILSVKDGNIERINSAVYNGKVLKIENSWLNMDLFLKEFDNADLSETYSFLYDAINEWNWKNEEMAGIMTCFVMLAPFQQAMTIRPWIYTLASAGSGKTKFYEKIMQLIYGNLSIRLDNATANGVNQTLTFSGYIPLFDNFEPSKKNCEILSNFESTTSIYGSSIWRGGQDLKAKKLQTNHMLWLNSVSSVSTTQAKDSRTVKFKINQFDKTAKFMKKKDGKLLQCRIIASVIKNWDRIQEFADKYTEKYHNRTVELISYPLAIQEIIQGSEIPEAELPAFVMERTRIDDGMQLLEAILNKQVKADYDDRGVERPVYEILLDESLGRNPLANKGLKKVNLRKGGTYLAIYSETVRSNILKSDNRYNENYGLDSILEGVDGAFRKKQKVSIKAKKEIALWNILIPFDYVELFKRNQNIEIE